MLAESVTEKGGGSMTTGIYLGILIWFIVVFVLRGFYIINQDQRAIKTVFGRAQRIGRQSTLDDPISANQIGRAHV